MFLIKVLQNEYRLFLQSFCFSFSFPIIFSWIFFSVLRCMVKISIEFKKILLLHLICLKRVYLYHHFSGFHFSSVLSICFSKHDFIGFLSIICKAGDKMLDWCLFITSLRFKLGCDQILKLKWTVSGFNEAESNFWKCNKL